jgi:hypothetical protein
VYAKFKVNITHSDKFDVVVGVGIYLTGKMLKEGKMIEKKLDREIKKLNETVTTLKEEFIKNNKKVLLLVIDDASPNKVDLSWIFNDYCIIELEDNVGIGHKENILETVAKYFAPFLFRFDQDVKIKGPIEPLFKAFEDMDDLFCAGIESGFIGAMYSRTYKDQEYVITPQLANGVMEKTSCFDIIGYTDPQLKYFHDLDLFYRAKDHGFKTAMVMESKGSAVASRAAGTMDMSKIQEEAKYLIESNKSLSYYVSKKGLPHIMYRPMARWGIVTHFPIKFVKSTELSQRILTGILRYLT